MPLSLRWVLAYVVVAILWISVMQWLLQSIGGDQWSISIGGLIVGGVFVLITAWLLFLLLERGHTRAVTAGNAHALIDGRARVWWAALGGLIGVTLLAQLFMVSFATREYRPVLLKQAHAELVGQVRLQAKAISDWLRQRNELVSRLSAQAKTLSERLQANQKSPAEALTELGPLVSDGQFVTITLYNADHLQKLQFGLKSAAKAPDVLFEQAAATSTVQFDCRFEAGRSSADCYWVLPLFLGHSEVSGGPWYLVFYGALDAASLAGHDTAESSHLARTSILLAPDESPTRHWLSLSLHPGNTPDMQGGAVRAVSPQDIACINRATSLDDLLRGEPEDQRSAAPPRSAKLMSGQLDCAPQSVLYASMSVPELHALLWAANTETAILHPIRKTRQLLAVAALSGVMALLLALFFFWQIMRLHRHKALFALVRERDQLDVFWEQMPSVGLALVDPLDWTVLNVNRRWAQIFHSGREAMLGQELLDVIQPVSGLSAVEEIRANDQQTLQDLCGGIREEVVLTRRIRMNDPAGEWVRISMRALKAIDQTILGVVVALDSLGETVDIAHQTQAERDFYRLAWALIQERNHAADGEGAALPLADAETTADRFSQLSTRIVEETGIMALCLYTHWPEAWSSSSDLTGPQIEQHEQKHFQCHGGSAPIRDIANQMAANGLIDRVLVAQTPIFIDDDVKTVGMTVVTLQAELIEQLKPYPVGAFAMIPMSAGGGGDCVRAWIVFAGEGMRFTTPVRTALMALLAVATEKLAASV
ncbi:PAS domain-containing protein [Halothiobacillus sp.]|uniref:PAS domain-containing protein n=1 Tax=Halothiobacillus sp. TaxID=1891311 RepID=UPI002AD32609|nr:PAS domain-containing protein [Halothiobacillus sp.]